MSTKDQHALVTIKTMTCQQLGSACTQYSQTKICEELLEQSQLHSKEIFMQQDQTHLKPLK